MSKQHQFIEKENKKRDRPFHRKDRGFALIVSLTMLVLLTIIAVGLLSLSAITLRTTTQTMAQAEAQANARLALMIAIGELQRQLGPDQRISAKAEILDTTPNSPEVTGVANPHYLGVWDSWDTWLTDNRGTLSIQDTYGVPGRHPSLFRGWLVSHPEAGELGAALSGSPGTDPIILLGEGGAGPDPAKHVEAARVAVRDGDQHTGNYAWWVSDESQKARLDMARREESGSAIETQQYASHTGRMGIEKMASMAGFATDSESLSKMVSTAQAGISAERANAHFHDITAYSLGLHTDVRFGGFKSDLNLAFESDDIPEQMRSAMLFNNREFDAPIRPMTGLLAGITPQNPYIGPISWRQMREYYRLYRTGFADSGMMRPVSWDNGNPTAQRLLIGKQQLYQWDTKGYARLPVMLRQTWIIATSTSRDELNPSEIAHYIIAVPVITLWNPYNVILNVKSRELSYLGSLHYAMNIRQTVYRDGAVVSDTDMPDETSWGSQNPNRNITADQLGYRMIINENAAGNQPVVFKPGEVRIFSTNEEILHGGTYGSMNNRFFFATPGYDLIQDTNSGVLRGLKYRVFTGTGQGVPELALSLLSRPVRPDPDNGRDVHGSDIRLIAGPRAAPIIGSFQSGHDNNDNVILEDGRTLTKTVLNNLTSANYFWDMSWIGVNVLNWITPNEFNDAWLVGSNSSNRARWPAPGAPPLPVGMVSVVAKSPERLSYDRNSGFGADFRNRGWLHAPPTQMNNFLMEPNWTTRTENAYQLHFAPVGSDQEISQFLEADGPLGFFGGGYSLASGQSHVTALALPTAPITNLGSFASIRMATARGREELPGSGRPVWHRYSRLKVTAHNGGAFGPGIGNAYAHPMIHSDRLYTRNEMGTDNMASYYTASNLTTGTGLNLNDDYWDHLFLANEELWDSWFCSGVTPVVVNGSVTKPKRQVAEDFFSGRASHVPGHFQPALRGRTPEELAGMLETTNASAGENGWDRIGSHILNKGQFNVNSTSKDAWKAMLMSLSERPIAVNNIAGGVSVTPPDPNRVTLSRYPMANSPDTADGPQDDNAWRGIRKLTEAEIDKLAEEIVRQVKLRGPFLNMTEFINRRLTPDATGVTGTLQAAIDWDEFNTEFNGTTSGSGPSINSAYKTSADMIRESQIRADYPNRKAAAGSRFAGIPGYVMQSDIFQGISSSLHVRGDTFLIRAYGESLTKAGSVVARAWCEAVVQRMPEYTDPTDEADKKIRKRDQLSGFEPLLNEANRTYGRRFHITSFRWLNQNEV